MRIKINGRTYAVRTATEAYDPEATFLSVRDVSTGAVSFTDVPRVWFEDHNAGPVTVGDERFEHVVEAED